jgi:hypothetical protein
MRLLLAVFISFSLSTFSYADDQFDENRLVENILHDVIDRVIEETDRNIRQTSGISLSDIIYETEHYNEAGERLSDVIKEERGNGQRSGHGRGGPPEGFPGRGGTPDEVQRELQQIARERDREIQQIREELHRELNQERAEFARENRHNEKQEILAEKRLRLEEKVHDTYNLFQRKMVEENRRYHEKRERVLGDRR